MDDDKGTALVLINTEHGRKWFESISDKIVYYQRELSEVYSGNVCLDGSVKINPNSDKFLLALDQMLFSKALKKYGGPNLLHRVWNKGTHILRLMYTQFLKNK